MSKSPVVPKRSITAEDPKKSAKKGMSNRKQSKGDEAGGRPSPARRGTKDRPSSTNDNGDGHNDDGRVKNGHQCAVGDVEKQTNNI